MKPEHMWHRDKALSRQIKNELRDLWLEFDPIGIEVMDPDSFPRDEYDSYQGGTLKCLQTDAPEKELESYLTWVVEEHMGLCHSKESAKTREDFIGNLIPWFETVEKRTLQANAK